MSRGSQTRARARPRLLLLVMAMLLGVGGLLGLPVRAAADGPTTFTSTDVPLTIPAAGSTQEPGSASPYPSTLAVQGMAGAVTTVTVSFTGLSHTAASDIDALIVAPDGRNLLVMSDVGPPETATAATNINLTFADSAPTELDQVVAGEVVSGNYKPTNNLGVVGDNDTFPAPAPTPSANSTLSQAFTGMTSANGTWSLFIVDDESTGDTGTLAGWSLTVTTEVAAETTTTTLNSSAVTTWADDPVTFTAAVSTAGGPVTTGAVQFTDGTADLGTPVSVNSSGIATYTTAPNQLAEGDHQIRATYTGSAGVLSSISDVVTVRVDNRTVVTGKTFCNPGRITTPTSGSATPYPSKVFVSGLAGRVSKVTAALKGVNHTDSIDLDVLLAGPSTSQNLFLLSDVGGSGAGAAVDANLTFDDQAGQSVPSTLVTGTYLPTNRDDESADSMPGPAPTPSAATLLSTFDGTSPNGTWTLWVVDDAPGGSGSVADGWCLTIETKFETETDLTAVPTSSIFGQSVTFTAAVTAGDDPVTAGQVEFRDGGSLLETRSVDADGIATFTTSDLSVNTHTITANYVGTDTNGTSTDTLSYVVRKRPTVTVVTSSGTPSSVGQTVTFTATVTDAGNPVTVGTVQFSIDGTDVGAALPPDDNGRVTSAPIGSLAAGSYRVEATYSGTDILERSTGRLTPDQLVERLQPTGTLTPVPLSPAEVNESVTFTAIFTVGSEPATPGEVDFTDDGDAITGCSNVAVDASGAASCTTTFAEARNHPIVATFGQTDTYAEATVQLNYVVGLIRTETTLSSAPDPSDPGDTVTITATVTKSLGGAAITDGNVTISIDDVDRVTRAVDANGRVTLTVDNLDPGRHELRASYLGTETIANSQGVDDHAVRPIADAAGPYAVAEGGSLALDGSGSTEGVSYHWDLNGDDDFTDATGATPTLTWDQLEALGINDGPGTRAVRLVVRIDDVDSEPATAELTVTNTAPASVLTGGLTATVGQPFTIKVGADDPSSADMAALFTYTVDWGDGSPVLTVGGPADPPVTHTYSVAGNFTATFTATDKDGGTGPGTQVVVLAQLAPSPSPTPTTTDPYDYDDTGSGELASTGSVVGIASILVTVLLLGAGAGMVIAGRRRSGRHQG